MCGRPLAFFHVTAHTPGEDSWCSASQARHWARLSTARCG
jgi:hypothetical protein